MMVAPKAAASGGVLVVGTTSDYVERLESEHPGRCLFLNDARAAAREPQIKEYREIVADLTDPLLASVAVDDYLSRTQEQLGGIVCFDCESMPLAALLAARLNLSYQSRNSVATARNKYASVRRWHRAGLLAPESALVRSEACAVAFFRRARGPLVLKPLSGTGSELVFLCDTEKACRSAYRTMRHLLATHPDVRMYAPLQDETGGIDPRSVFVVEEFIEGIGWSCDFVVDGGEVRVIRVCQKVTFAEEPLGTVNAYLMPADLPRGMSLDSLEHQLSAAAAALGFDRALCVVDLVVRNGDVVLLEMAPRPAGDCLPALIRDSVGFDVLGYALDFALGAPVPTIGPARRLAAVRLLADETGRIAHLEAASLRTDPRVVSLRLERRVGDSVAMPPAGCDQRLLGHVVFEPAEHRSIEDQCREIRARLGVVIEPRVGEAGSRCGIRYGNGLPASPVTAP